ncbi:ferredoxin--NADP reductase [Reichenbachiella ulvae]|uniref:Ferredoxin--NADP reductase n=1 Tax=Reichenbachiella ulvae TaxID=2980104 RepID=A0ABT3CRR4_9BACT|nr:ferredoxin--NADP reductase [Reichenbachiella ulvae]MCV9386312.1 ferredoxin--NADP reductase [Reichenbachiella ulvae]
MGKVSKLKILKVVKETEDAVSIHFKQPFFRKIKYTPGQFLTLLVNIDGRVERRCYSLNSAPNVDKEVSVTVKRIKDGRVSNYLFENIKEGDKIKVLHPMGEFTLLPNPAECRHVVLFGAGSGITPLMSILKTVLNFEERSYVSLFYGNRDKESIIFNNDLRALKAIYPDRLNLVHILENPGDFEDCYKGRVERSQVPGLLNDLPELSTDKTLYYICGPSGMMTEAEEGLKLAGVDPKFIHIEKFSAPPPSAQEAKTSGPLLENREVTIIHKGKEHRIPVKANRTILDSALDHKLKLPYVCMDGICGSCKASCESGEVYMRSGHVLSAKEVEDGVVLPCLCKPLTNNVVIKYA